MTTRNFFENRTFHIYTEHAKNNKCSGESNEYIPQVKFGVIMKENCRNVSTSTNGISSLHIARSFGRVYPNYQLRNDVFDISCNKIK